MTAEQIISMEAAQAAMDAAVVAKAESDREFKAANSQNDLELVAVINDAKEGHADRRETIKNEHDAATKIHNQSIAKARRLVGAAAKVASVAKAEAKAAAETPKE